MYKQPETKGKDGHETDIFVTLWSIPFEFYANWTSSWILTAIENKQVMCHFMACCQRPKKYHTNYTHIYTQRLHTYAADESFI